MARHERLLVLIETVMFTRVNVTALLVFIVKYRGLKHFQY